MSITKETIKDIILGGYPDFKRFEMMESFAKYADETTDVEFLVNVLRNDSSSVLRHEAAAQLLKIEQKKPWLINQLKDFVIESLLNVVMNDKSLVARHESVEALSYIGDKNVLKKLDEIIKTENENSEIIETVKIARDIIEYRIIKDIKASDLGSTILSEKISHN
jgi:HEAT repeat protein